VAARLCARAWEQEERKYAHSPPGRLLSILLTLISAFSFCRRGNICFLFPGGEPPKGHYSI